MKYSHARVSTADQIGAWQLAARRRAIRVVAKRVKHACDEISRELGFSPQRLAE